jgi:hypothetical protein
MVKSKNCAKFRLFNPQGYEFPDFVTTFADGSGRIDIKLLKYFFDLSANSPVLLLLLI